MPEFWFFLFPLSTHIGGSVTGEQDRYGDSCDLDVYALRLGHVALILVPEGEEHASIYGPFPLDELIDHAARISAQYDMGEFLCRFDPSALDDRFDKVAGVLSKAYRPHPQIRPADPRDILRAIAGLGETEKARSGQPGHHKKTSSRKSGRSASAAGLSRNRASAAVLSAGSRGP